MLNRRDLFETLLKKGAGAVLCASLAAAVSQASDDIPVFDQELPAVSLNNWTVRAFEVTYAPGESSTPHRHPGFVLGYVLEGAIRFALKGQDEKSYRAGQMFYEPPGSVHFVSSNASATQRARFLAMIFAEKGTPDTLPA